MTQEEKYQLIEDLDTSEEEKEKMRKLVAAGTEAESTALAYVQAEYGFEEAELECVQRVGNNLAGSVLSDVVCNALSNDPRINDEQRARIISAMFDYAKIITRNYHKSKTEVGL